MKRNKKGFTLIELLAVIVILAILILLATPAVVGLMNKAKFNAFKLEVSSIEEIAKTAYTLNKDEAQKYDVSEIENCYTLEWLKENGYIDKNFKNPGCVFIDNNGQITYLIYNDGNYVSLYSAEILETLEYQEFLDYKAEFLEFYNSIVNNITETKDMCTAAYEFLTNN